MSTAPTSIGVRPQPLNSAPRAEVIHVVVQEQINADAMNLYRGRESSAVSLRSFAAQPCCLHQRHVVWRHKLALGVVKPGVPNRCLACRLPGGSHANPTYKCRRRAIPSAYGVGSGIAIAIRLVPLSQATCPAVPG